MLLFLPFSHCFGQNAILNTGIHAGATIVIQRRFVLEDVLAAIASGEVTKVFGVPSVFIRLLASEADPALLARVPYYFSAAARLPRAVERAWHERTGRPIHQGYGLTETSPFSTYNYATAFRERSVGTAIDGVDVAIADADGRLLPSGTIGEIVVRGPNVMLGYWRNPAETARVMSDDWFRTGDLGYLDADGYLHIVDRLKDLINVSGFKVYPAEVEQLLAQHPDVVETAVYGRPDPITGEQVCAAVVLHQNATASGDDLAAFCRESIAAYKVPVSIELRDSLPKNGTGKVLKRLLVEESPSR